MDSLIPSYYAVGGFCTIFFGYMIHSSILEYIFYYKQGQESSRWKIQTTPTTLKHLHLFYGFPLFSSKPNRGPYHRYLVTWNLLIASCIAGITAELSVRRINKMEFYEFSSLQSLVLTIFLECLIATVYQSVVEYYWHRLMHLRFFYINLHKYHHFYKSPEPWDDMYIHPLEAFGYYCILYGPPYLFSLHYYSFIAYMIIMGICGVLDHSGIKFEVPYLYNTIDHDNHHKKFEVNYSFPFPFMDILHNTYDGIYAGKQYKAIKIRSHEE